MSQITSLNPSVKTVDTAAYTSYSGVISLNDNIPQITDGTQIFSQTINLKTAASKVRITATIQGAVSVANIWLTIAAFRNSVANSVGTSPKRWRSVELDQDILDCIDSPGIAGDVTYSIRLGVSSDSFYTNGNSGSRFMGGTSKCTLVLEEILP